MEARARARLDATNVIVFPAAVLYDCSRSH